MHILSITNKLLYLDFNVIDNFDLLQHNECLTDVIFCGVLGSLVISENNLIFTVINIATTFDVNVCADYKTVILTLQKNLREKYRAKNNYSYFNKKFSFDITTRNNCCNIIISKR